MTPFEDWRGSCQERFSLNGETVVCEAPLGWIEYDNSAGVAARSFRPFTVCDDRIPFSGAIIAICEDCAAER